MVSGSFRTNILLRVLLITASLGSLLFVLMKKSWVITPFVLSLLCILAVWELLRYAEKANNEFTDFLQSIRSADFTRYNEEDMRGTSFRDLRKSYNAIVDAFRHARFEKEAHYTFLQTVVSNFNTAIISFDAGGSVQLMNEAAQALLELPFLNNMSRLQQLHQELYEHLTAGTNGIAEMSIHGRRVKLLLRSAHFQLQGTEHTLVLITNVKSEIDRTQTEAWEQLLRVLTHEMMNSITPISSLSCSIREHLNTMIAGNSMDAETLQDMAEGLQVIEKRSAGLIGFVNNYKSLISLPQPSLKKVEVAALFERIELLVGNDMKRRSVTLTTERAGSMLLLVADEPMVEQVLLNLIYNAADALADTPDPSIVLSAGLFDEQTFISVSDNGHGIDPDILSSIFIPFYTTKNHGTGIGLSLSRQIMRLHNGSIDVRTEQGKGTTFTLTFP